MALKKTDGDVGLSPLEHAVLSGVFPATILEVRATLTGQSHVLSLEGLDCTGGLFDLEGPVAITSGNEEENEQEQSRHMAD